MANMDGKRKRSAFTLNQKVAIIKAVDSGRKKGEVAAEFEIAPSTLSTILKDKEKLVKEFVNGHPGKRQRLRSAVFPDVDEAVLKWFTDVRARNIAVSGAMIQDKANSMASLLGHEDFKASMGWVSRFKERHGIVCRVAAGEAAAVNPETTWRDMRLYTKEKAAKIRAGVEKITVGWASSTLTPLEERIIHLLEISTARRIEHANQTGSEVPAEMQLPKMKTLRTEAAETSPTVSTSPSQSTSTTNVQQPTSETTFQPQFVKVEVEEEFPMQNADEISPSGFSDSSPQTPCHFQNDSTDTTLAAVSEGTPLLQRERKNDDVQLPNTMEAVEMLTTTQHKYHSALETIGAALIRLGEARERQCGIEEEKLALKKEKLILEKERNEIAKSELNLKERQATAFEKLLEQLLQE